MRQDNKIDNRLNKILNIFSVPLLHDIVKKLLAESFFLFKNDYDF